MSQTGPTFARNRTKQKSASLTTSQVIGLIGLVLVAGIVAAVASLTSNVAAVVPIVVLTSSLLFMTEFLDTENRIGRAISIGMYVAAIALTATTGPALAGLIMVAATTPLLFLNARHWSVGHRLLTEVAASMVAAAGFWAVEQSQGEMAEWPRGVTIPIQSALAVIIVLVIHRVPGAPYQERFLSLADILLIVTPLTVVVLSFEAILSERHLAFATVALLIAFVCLGVLARLVSRGRGRFNATRAVEGLVTALDHRHPDTSAHSSRVFALVSRMVEGVHGLDPREREAILNASLIHDIGKIATPDEALLKPGALTLDERAVMQQHSAIGEEIVRQMDGLEATAPIVRHHHERWDGAGYPDGLVGSVIPLGSRMIAVADTYDAMTHDRIYRRALGHNEALAELFAERGRQFDPLVVDIFSRVIAMEQAAANRRSMDRRVEAAS